MLRCTAMYTLFLWKTRIMNRNSHFWRNKGFYLTVFLLFATYEVGAWCIEEWFNKRQIIDSVQLNKQKLIERSVLEKVTLTIAPTQVEKTTMGAPVKSLEEIFNESEQSLLTTQLLAENTKLLLEDFILFKKSHQSLPLSMQDMKQMDNGLLHLFNLYSSISISQHPDIRLKNIQNLKQLFAFHKENALNIYGIDSEVYQKAYPVFYSIIISPEKIIEDVFFVEYKLKQQKDDYLLSIGGDILKKEYEKLSDGKVMPDFVERNVSLLNQYIKNISKKE